MNEIESILRPYLKEVNSINNKSLDKVVSKLITAIQRSKIESLDKAKMIVDLKSVKSPTRLIRYVYNSILKYEGDGVIGL